MYRIYRMNSVLGRGAVHSFKPRSSNLLHPDHPVLLSKKSGFEMIINIVANRTIRIDTNEQTQREAFDSLSCQNE